MRKREIEVCLGVRRESDACGTSRAPSPTDLGVGG